MSEELKKNTGEATEQSVDMYGRNRIKYLTKGNDNQTWMFHVTNIVEAGKTYPRFLCNHVQDRDIQKAQNPLNPMNRIIGDTALLYDLDFDVSVYGDTAHVILLCGSKENPNAPDIKTAIFFFTFKIGGGDYIAEKLYILDYSDGSFNNLSLPRISSNTVTSYYEYYAWVTITKDEVPSSSYTVKSCRNEDAPPQARPAEGEADDKGDFSTTYKIGNCRVDELNIEGAHDLYNILFICKFYDDKPDIKRLYGAKQGSVPTKLQSGSISSLHGFSYYPEPHTLCFTFTWINDNKAYTCSDIGAPVIECFKDTYDREFFIKPNYCKFVSYGKKIALVDLANLNNASPDLNDDNNSYVEPIPGKTSVRVYNVDFDNKVISAPKPYDLEHKPYSHFAGLIKEKELRLIYSDSTHSQFDVAIIEV